MGPLPLPGGGLVGGAVHERRGRYYSLFPWASGRQVRRAEVGPGEAAAMGACLARLHVALADFPVEVVPVPRRAAPPSRAEALAAMEALGVRIRAALPADRVAPTALARLAEQRAHLERLPDGAPAAAGALREQVIHGDLQETNLFFSGDAAAQDTEDTEDTQVTAIIDWDQTHVAPRASEIFRTFDYVFDFEAERCRRFLQAYRSFQTLPLEELDVAALAYDAKRSRGLWLYEELYVRGNRRVAQFIERSGPYLPVSERWARVREACAPTR